MWYYPDVNLSDYINQMKQFLADGRQDELFTMLSDVQRRLAAKGMTQDKKYWTWLQKNIAEPAFLNLVLKPAGIDLISNPNQFGVDYLSPSGTAVEDLKFQAAPFFTANKVYTFSLNFDDMKYDPKTIVNLYHHRTPGMEWTVRYRSGVKKEIYDGPPMNVICRVPVSDVLRKIDSEELTPQEYKDRTDDFSGNEKRYYRVNIRWFPIWRRRVAGQWVESAWTEEETEELKPPIED